MKTRVLLDTNALLLFGQRHLDLFSAIDDAMEEPYELLVPELVLKELESLARGRSRDGEAAKLGLVLVRQKQAQGAQTLVGLLASKKQIPLKIVPGSSDQHADDAILRIAEDEPVRTVVATLDRGLQGRLLASKVRVLTVRQGRVAFKR